MSVHLLAMQKVERLDDSKESETVKPQVMQTVRQQEIWMDYQMALMKVL